MIREIRSDDHIPMEKLYNSPALLLTASSFTESTWMGSNFKSELT